MTRLISHFQTLTVVTVMLLASVFLNAGPVFGQGTSTGTVTGVATDTTGAVVPGVTVTLADATTGSRLTTVSNNDGQYVFVNVQPGTYSISSAKPGFSKDEIQGVVVSVGTQTTANFKMVVGSQSTIVEVLAAASDLQTMNATTGTSVDPAMVESLPAIGRDVATFVTMQPGVTPGGNVAGTTVDQATFQLDGGSNSSDMDGTQGVYTSNNVNSSIGGFFANATGPGGVVPMPQDSIEEFKVSTSGQTADFNNSSGSQSQIVTKRGHDKWHGTVYEYYLDSNIGANTWQNNFPSAYTPKPSYHFNRFGAAAGGPIGPRIWGGKTYFFANYEGFRYPLAATYERTVPSYEFLQLGQLTFGTKKDPITGATVPNTFSAADLKAKDPRGIGMNATLANVYKTQLPQAPVGNNGSVSGLVGTFDSSCGVLSGAVCDGVNIIGYKANVLTPQSSNFLATRMDHDFGDKWHLMASYRYYSLTNLTSNQVDIGGVLPGDTLGVPKALTPRPQSPWFFVVGLTTNISSSLTNDFHYSYLRNAWQWKGAGAPAQVGVSGAIEPLGENTASSQPLVLSPYNVNAQQIRTRIWNGKDNYFSDNLTKLAGNHLIQFGGQYQHNYNYHQRTDNGASINYTPTYQIGGDTTGGNITYSSSGIGGVATTGPYRRIADTYYGFVTATQVANTYSNSGGTLSLNPPLTPIGANTTIPYYNMYVTDTWHAKPSLSINYGLSYAIEMPPSERNGNQVMFTDVSGNAIRVDDYLSNRKTAALAGQIYNPEIGFALVKNVVGGRKYPYDPYYAAFSPRLSFAWNPKFDNASLAKIFGDGATVVRGGYGRIYGRINGDTQVLNPLLSPGLILATQCKYAQNSLGSGTCTQTNFNETTAYRFGTDGTAPALTNSALPPTLAQPYHPGFDGPGVSIASPVDPSMRPNDVDTFNLSIQRQVNRKMMVEVGYIGRLIHHEYIMENPNVIPYMMSLGGQSFASAYLAIEGAFGCATSASLCSTTAAKAGTKSTSVNPNVAPQPFFETALAGTGYCNTYSSCTAAVVAKQASNFGAQNVFTIWQALDNNVNGAGGTGFNFARSLMGTPTSSAQYGGAGQVVTGLSIGTANGYSNYHGGYVSFKTSDFHGLTFQENLTISKALGLNAYNQSTSSIAAVDSFNLREQYGRQSFDQKAIFNTFIVYQIPYYSSQNGIVGRLAGGWTLSPVLTAGTGQPLQCVTNNSGQNFGGEDGATFTDSNENCVFTTPYSGGRPQTYRGVTGGTDPNGVAVGTTPKGNVNFFSNPVAVYDNVRPLLLGLDSRSGGGGRISGLGYLNLDLSVKKRLVVYEKVSMEFTGVITNIMNHLDFANPSMSLQSTSNWGTSKTQGNTPRQIQMGVRASF